jgi:hypothetical protein
MFKETAREVSNHHFPLPIRALHPLLSFPFLFDAPVPTLLTVHKPPPKMNRESRESSRRGHHALHIEDVYIPLKHLHY